MVSNKHMKLGLKQIFILIFKKLEMIKKIHRMGISIFSKWTMMFSQMLATRY